MNETELRIVDFTGRVWFQGTTYAVSAQPGEWVALSQTEQGVVRVHPDGTQDPVSPCVVTPDTCPNPRSPQPGGLKKDRHNERRLP